MEEITYDNFDWSPEDNDKFHSPESKMFQKKRLYEPRGEVIKTIYVDGGSRLVDVNEDGVRHYVGAWAFYDNDMKELRGGPLDWATNQVAELTAAVKALEYCNEIGVPKNNGIVKINLDSNYVKNGCISWIYKWVQNDWSRQVKQGDGSYKTEELKNKDLWMKLYDLIMDRGRYNIWWNHVKAHSGIEGNEYVDIKCGECMDEFMEKHGYTSKKMNFR